MRLCHLQAAWDVVHATVFSETSARLLEMERHVGRDALLSDAKHPIIVADTGFGPRLASDRNLLTPGAKQTMEMDGSEQRLADDRLVQDGQFAEKRKALVGASLVLHRATDGDMFVAIAPVIWQT